MPNKNGYQVCDELKKDPQYNNINVVLLTAVGEVRDFDQLYPHGRKDGSGR